MENTDTLKKDTAKEKIILFIIGVLVGAVISTVAFLISVKTLGVNNSSSSPEMSNNSTQTTQGETPPEKPSDEGSQGSQGGQSDQGGTPPAKPEGENTSNSNS